MTEQPETPSLPVVQLQAAGWGPFIYRKMVGRVPAGVQDGDLVAVVDKAGKPFGCGFYNAKSMITLRMVSWGADAVDEKTFIDTRIARAVGLRRDILRLDEVTDACRLVHAEGDQMPGLIADRYGPFVVLEFFSKAMFLRVEAIRSAFAATGVAPGEFILRADEDIARQEGFWIKQTTEPSRRVIVTENGVKFEVDLTRGHKTGFFCDQRDNRLALTGFTPGKSVLDLCCYSGGFSCYAATRGAAADVTAVDIDETALETAERNRKLNRVAIQFKQSDVFEYLRNARRDGKSWDVIIADPSKFVPNREEMERGLKKYRDLNALAAGVLKPGGILLTCSCSGLVSQEQFVDIVARAGRFAGRSVQVFRVTGPGGDHPVMADAPQSGYLKAVWARVE